jgi:hypothetical protein
VVKGRPGNAELLECAPDRQMATELSMSSALRPEMIENKNRADTKGSIRSISKDKEHIAPPNMSDEPLPTLPLAPTLVPVLGRGNASANSDSRSLDARTEMVRAALEMLPIGSTVVFAADDLGALFLGAPIFLATDAYRAVEHIAQTCNCFVSLQEETGTIAFYRRENC